MRQGSANERRWLDPAALLRHLGITRPEEIDVEAIARYCNARVSYQPLRGCEGRLVGHRGRAVIVVNSDSHPYRQRFTIAHELGHWMFDRVDVAHTFTERLWGKARRPKPPSEPAPYDPWYEDLPEQRANRWAAELLMPEHLFAADAAGREISFITARDLARRYNTSLTATALRLIDLGSTPSMLVCSRAAKRFKWFMHGAGVPQQLWPLPEPDYGSVARDLIEALDCPDHPIDVPANTWFERNDAWWFRVREHSIKIAYGEYLSLLSWPDDTQLRAMYTLVGTWLPWKPGKNARSRLVKCLCEKWGYRRRRGKPGETALETATPSAQRLVVPPIDQLSAARDLRRVVDDVAAHHGVQRGEVLWSMLKRPKWADRPW